MNVSPPSTQAVNKDVPTGSKQDVVAYIVSQDLVKVSSLLPSNVKRSYVVHSLVQCLGLLQNTISDNEEHETPLHDGNPRSSSTRRRRIQVKAPVVATDADLLAYHDADFLAYILRGARTSPSSGRTENPGDASQFGLEDDCEPFYGLPAYVRMVAGASITAARCLSSGEAVTAICWDGGRHHARKSQASGFCYVADCVLAILHLRKAPRKPRIFYLDLDLHFGDAVSEAFLNSSQVLTLSVHHAAPGFFPANELAQLTEADTANPFTVSIPLQAGASAAIFKEIWPSIEAIREAFDPEFVVVQCGADGLAGDPCKVWNWSLFGEGSMSWCFDRIVNRWDCKTLLLGGGGYHSANAARAWATITSIALLEPILPERDIPDHAAFPLYGPSFTFDVPGGNMRDENSSEYVQRIKEQMFSLASRIANIRESE
ncbi:histone deacetylase complex protein [Sistotremastrum suecicum HHB10207 ss-3]|uniref:Histone deacetylase complex protein n=1 Tax=Sistotremastrum suecicum HHB10207 ss-3 TaxID=1314776 RepID=A0A166ECP9_9AGAM|nr:histone deacetylase complex protein [Sistotremastrum suecicum HHB10207 ss-3]